MAKKSKARKPQNRPRPSTTVPITLDRIALRRLSYVEVKFESPPVPAEGRINIDLSLDGRLNLMKQGVEIFLDVKIRPEVAHLPYEVEVGISAFFRREDAVADQELLEFAQGPGMRIVYPYVREITSNVTSRGLFGPLWLDPTVFAVQLGEAPNR